MCLKIYGDEGSPYISGIGVSNNFHGVIAVIVYLTCGSGLCFESVFTTLCFVHFTFPLGSSGITRCMGHPEISSLQVLINNYTVYDRSFDAVAFFTLSLVVASHVFIHKALGYPRG